MKKLFCCVLVVTATLWSHTASSVELAARGWGIGRRHNQQTQQQSTVKAKTTRNQDNTIQWLTDFDEATRRARREQKPMFVLFTGSDWCPWCIRLEKEILHTDEFAQGVGNKFVFVTLDFPRRQTQPTEVAQQNQHLKSQYSVKGFPTVLLLDTQQRQIGATGYRAGGPRAYISHLDEVTGGY